MAVLTAFAAASPLLALPDGGLVVPLVMPGTKWAARNGLRVTVVTDLLNQNVVLEDVQYLAGHASPTTTRIYDRRRRKVTRNIVERISI